jgi:hypothetical protein
MLRYSEQDATRIHELQEITSQFRKSLMLAYMWKKTTGADWHAPGVLQKLGSEANKAQDEIDDIVRRNYRRQRAEITATSGVVSSPSMMISALETSAPITPPQTAASVTIMSEAVATTAPII